MNDLQKKVEELSSLSLKASDLYKKLSQAYRMEKVWPECFSKGKAEIYTTSLGGTGTIPKTTRYWIRRMADDAKFELSIEQWNYIKAG